MNKLKNLNALLLEDDDSLRDELKEILSIFFKNVYSAENGLVGLDLYKSKNIDIIFTDYVMPQMDGCTFIKKIRESNKDIPVLILTNYTDKDKLLSLITLNITEFLIKPVNYENIVEVLEKIDSSLDLEPNSNFIKINNHIDYDKEKKCLIINDKEVSLTKNEISFIEILITNQNSTISFESLAYAFDNTYKSEQAIKNMIYRLNQKTKVKFLKNIQGIGYKIDNS